MAGRYKSFLLFIADADNKQVKLLLQNATKPQILSIREVCVNILKGNVTLGTTQKQKLKKERIFLRTLANKGVSRCVLAKKSKVVKELLLLVKPVLDQL